MAKELEAAGIPVAYITTLDALARLVGANRTIRGKAIVNVVGAPSLPPAEELRFRRQLVATALRALATTVEGPTVLGDAPDAQSTEPVAVRSAATRPAGGRTTA